MNTGRNARVSLQAPLNRKWWDEAKAKVMESFDALTDYESEFVHGCYDAEVMGGVEWNPTTKQFNFMRELARKF